MISRRRFAVIAIAGIAITIPVSRTAAATSTSEPPGSPPANALSGDINVFAAASLTNAFEAIAVEFEAANPDADLVFNFAASSELAASIVDDGAPADVFASADQNNMNKLVDAGLDDGDPATFATNSLAIVVEPGNPQGIGGVEDLADPDLIVVATSPEVPIGAYTQQVFEAAGVEVTPDSFEENVRGILTKVTEGEADAGVVYVSDVFAAGEDAEGVDIPAEINVVAEYPISRGQRGGQSGRCRRLHRLRAERRGPGHSRRLRLRASRCRVCISGDDRSADDDRRPGVDGRLMSGGRAARRRRAGAERLPLPVFALAVAAVAFFALPFIGLLWRTPWSSVWSVLTDSTVLTALRLSLVTTFWATGLSLLFGVPLAWLLARVAFPGRGLVRALCTLSMVLPPVVGGVALFFAVGRRGLFGQYLDRWFGLRLPFTTAGVVVAQTFVAMPFLVLTVEGALRQLDRRYDDAARTLGSSTLVPVPPGDTSGDPSSADRRRRARLGQGTR